MRKTFLMKKEARLMQGSFRAVASATYLAGRYLDGSTGLP